MAVLPIERVVDVSVTRQDNFPTITGFGIPMVVTDETTGPVDATTRTKVYASMTEVAADWDAADEAYKALNVVFSQNPRPKQARVGFRATGGGQVVADELDAIAAYDNDWYQLIFTKSIQGVTADEDSAIAWAESKEKLHFLGSTNTNLEVVSDTTNVAARHKDENDRTGVFYGLDASEYPEAAAAAYTATRNFDKPNSAYTLKFKKMRGISALNKASAIVQAITGFVPGTGLSSTAGHIANCYVNIGGSTMFVEGTVLSKAFIDEIHTTDWLVARLREGLLGVLATNDKIPMDDPGIQILASGVEAVMNRAVAAGLVARDFDEDGEELPAFTITPTRVRNISAAQRRQRIAPDIAVEFRLAGAVHYASVRVNITF